MVQVMAWCHQATSRVTWANVDPDRYLHMTSPDHNGIDQNADDKDHHDVDAPALNRR